MPRDREFTDVATKAIKIFGDSKKFVEWFHEPNDMIAGLRPCETSKDVVYDILTIMEKQKNGG